MIDYSNFNLTKMGLEDYISRHPNQKSKKGSAYDEESIVSKIKLISASVISLNLKSTEPAPRLNRLMQAQDPAHQITPKIAATYNAINLITTQSTRVHIDDYYLFPAPRNHVTNTSCSSNNSKYAYRASEITINTSIAQRNKTHCKQLFQNGNEKYLAKRDSQFTQPNFPPIRRHFTNVPKSHYPKIASVLFASNYPENKLPNSPSNNFTKFKRNLDINHMNKIKYNIPSKKRITRIRFTDPSRTKNPTSTYATSSRYADQPPNSVGATCAANQPSNSPSATRAANPTLISTPTSTALSSNISIPLTTSPPIPTFDHIFNKIFSKSQIASLSSKDAVLKEVRDCILTNNESQLKALNLDIHSYWRNLHIRCGCICIDKKVDTTNIPQEALID